MSELYDTAIIGGGIFGCLCAIELSKLGKEVILLEQNSTLMNGASSNNTRAVWASDGSTNVMEFVTIATTGNASDFGDQNGTPQHLAGVTSDSHGGLS